MKLKNIFRLSSWKRRIGYFYEYARIKILIFFKYRDCVVLLPFYPLGETFITISLVDEYIKTYNNKVVIIIKKQMYEFAKCFKNIHAIIVTTENFISVKNYSVTNKSLKKGLVKGYIYHLRIPPYKKLENYFPKNMTDYHKYLLNLKSDAKLSKLVINNNLLNALKNKYNLTENSILLSPEANSLNYKEISIIFWKQLADILIKEGYNVIFNTKNNEFSKYNCIFETILNTIYISQNCKCVIAFRSGITDILAGTISKKIFVIYPSQKPQLNIYISNDTFTNFFKDAYPKYNFTTLEQAEIDMHSLVTMYNRNDITEVLFDRNENKLINEILDFIK